MLLQFVELAPFRRYREDYLSDALFRSLQSELIAGPERGVLIKNSGGLRKIRARNPRSMAGKRGGLRVIYYWEPVSRVIYLFTIYSKSEVEDLSQAEIRILRQMLAQTLGESS